MLIINYFFFLKFRGFTFVLILNGSHLKRRSALNDVPMAPALKIPVTTRTDGRCAPSDADANSTHQTICFCPLVSLCGLFFYIPNGCSVHFFFCFVLLFVP